MPDSEPSATRDDLRSSIVEAAARLLQDEGAQAVTTRAVAQAAGVQAPTIYRLFGDKDGLIEAVAEHVMEAYVADKSTAPPTDDPVADLRAAWRRHVEFGVAHAELAVLLMTSGRGSPSPATRAGIEVLAMRVRRIAAAGLLRVEEQLAVQLIHAAGTGVVLALLGDTHGKRATVLSDTMFDAVAGAILATAPATPDRQPSTVAITFLTVLPDLPALTDAERTLLAEWIGRSLAASSAGSTGPGTDQLTARGTA